MQNLNQYSVFDSSPQHDATNQSLPIIQCEAWHGRLVFLHFYKIVVSITYYIPINNERTISNHPSVHPPFHRSLIQFILSFSIDLYYSIITHYFFLFSAKALKRRPASIMVSSPLQYANLKRFFANGTFFVS